MYNPSNIKTDEVVKITGQSLNGKKLIFKPENNEIKDNELSIMKEIQYIVFEITLV
jgi:hypothetical protein